MVPFLTDLDTIQSNTKGSDTGESYAMPLSILEPEPKPSADPSLLAGPSTVKGTSGETIVVNSPQLPLAPQKRSRELASPEVIDVDGMSSDDEIVLLEVRPPKVFLVT